MPSLNIAVCAKQFLFMHQDLKLLVEKIIIIIVETNWFQLNYSVFANCFSQESEPISNYLCSEIPKDVKQRIARMGVETMLKMVRSIISLSFWFFVTVLIATLYDQEVCPILSDPFLFSMLWIHICVSGFCGQLCPRRSPSWEYSSPDVGEISGFWWHWQYLSRGPWKNHPHRPVGHSSGQRQTRPLPSPAGAAGCRHRCPAQRTWSG